MSVSILLAAAGVIVAIGMLSEIVVGKFFARTVWGVLVVGTGFITPLVPVILGMNRQRFVTLRRGQQWLLTTMIPSAFVLAIVLFMICAQSSSRVIIGFTPTLFLRFDGLDQNGVPKFNFHMHGVRSSGVGGIAYDVPVGERLARDQMAYRFHLHAYTGPVGSRHGGEYVGKIGTVFKLSASVPPPKDGGVQITFDLHAKTKIKLQVDGLADVRISRDGEDVLQPVEFDPGQYTVVVEGHPIDG